MDLSRMIYAKKALCAGLLAAALITGTGLSFAEAASKWMTGDWHQHTFFTDGTNFMGDVRVTPGSPDTFTILDASDVTDPKADFADGDHKGVVPQGFRYGLDFQANSEHGGNRGSRDAFGRFWDSTDFYGSSYVSAIPLLGDSATYNNACSYLTVDSPSCGSASHRVMWRWQELMSGGLFGSYMSAYDWIAALRSQYPDKQIMTGMEWNVPGHEHASTGCLENNGKCIAEFEYRFDQNDTDATGPTTSTANAAGINWTGKIQTSAYTNTVDTYTGTYPDYSTVLGLNAKHNKTIAGLAWMQASHRYSSWVNPAHVERAGCGVGGYSIAAFRDMNNTAPDVFFGFEGMPGHQKAANRGEFSASACGGGTYGGAGKYIAEVGGMWDNLLADGRKIFNFASSDFHMTRDDFYPGEYAKTHVKVIDQDGDGIYTQQDIVNGMRSGNSYAVHGDLISDLDFEVQPEKSGKSARKTMGETLTIARGQTVFVKIRFKDGAVNNHGDVAKVHHVQLIQGRTNPSRAGKFLGDGVTPNPAFNNVDSSVAKVAKTFDASSWRIDEQGYVSVGFLVKNVQDSMFFRIRGTNKGYNEEGQTDAAGNPLLDAPGTNNEEEAWKDLWFYSNPIFVKVQ